METACFRDLAELYTRELLENILPFWMEHGLDKEHGGIYTCVDRQGKLMDGTKSVWFQGRSAYIFAYVYNHVKKDQRYLDASRAILDFMEAHCFDDRGRMYFEVTADGTPLRMRRYVFSETFAIIAFAEYALATGDQQYVQKAEQLFEKTLHFLNTPGILEPKYLPTLQAIGHSICMIMMNTAVVLGQVSKSPMIETQIEESFRTIKDKLYQPEVRTLLEMATPEGKMIDTLSGRVINPGHCIETSWFLMEAARAYPELSCAKEMMDFSFTVLNDAWHWGWDEQYGGIINFRDAKGFPAQDYSQDMKFWWPQTEAIIANLYAFLMSDDKRYMERHQLAHDWAWKHLRDTEYPEWYGYLHRDGTVAQPAKGNLFKGPFHIPRMLVKSALLCKEIDAKYDQ